MDAKKLVQNGRAFLHTKRDTACAAHGSRLWRRTAGGGEPVPDIPKKQEEKDFTLSRACALAV